MAWPAKDGEKLHHTAAGRRHPEKFKEIVCVDASQGWKYEAAFS